MSGKVAIRMPTGSPASAFLSTHAPTAATESPVRQLEPAVTPPPARPGSPPATREMSPPITTAAVAPTSVHPQLASSTSKPAKEPDVRFQVRLPVRLAKLVDAEVDRRKASGRRGRGKSDYTAIFRELVEKHLR